MAAKLRPRAMLPRFESSADARAVEPAAGSFSGLLGRKGALKSTHHALLDEHSAKGFDSPPIDAHVAIAEARRRAHSD